jgi:choline dehydrogenase-like flavoprotein
MSLVLHTTHNTVLFLNCKALSTSTFFNLRNFDSYPRGQALGGSAVHNALLNVDQSKWDFDNYASILGDSRQVKNDNR